MGAYAEAIRSTIQGAPVEPQLPRDTGWVVVTSGEITPAEACRRFPSASRLLILSAMPPKPSEGRVACARIELRPQPTLSEDAVAKLAAGYGALILADGPEAASGRLVRALARHGVTIVAYRDPVSWTLTSPRMVLARKPVARLERRVALSRPGRWYRRRIARALAHRDLEARNRLSFNGRREWDAHVARVGRAPRGWDGGALDVDLYIGQLNSGGAERQLTNLAIALRRRGHGVRVLTTYPLVDENAHYLHGLRDAGVTVRAAGYPCERTEGEFANAERRLAELQIHPEVVGAIPEVIRDPVLDLAGELVARPPHVLHCWLDYPNVIGAIAAALVGAGHVVLSTRNVDPTHFPAFYQGWMDPWYAFLTALPNVHLMANSLAGAQSYARWLGLDRERFAIAPNGVDVHGSEPRSEAELHQWRRREGVRSDQLLLAGVFRLAPEKQPLLFLDVVDRVRRRVPELHTVIVGVGPMRGAVEAEIHRRGLQDTVSLLAQRKDVATILQAADAMLLTSAVEGTPNVVLEAALNGCPVVATAVGGTPEVLEHGVAGWLHAPDDERGLARSTEALLVDRSARKRLGAAGRERVLREFSMDAAFDHTLSHYHALLGKQP